MSVTQEQARIFGEQQLATPLPKNGIVILYADGCTHCQDSLENTERATTTSNGTPVKWVDVDLPEGGKTFQTLPGLQTVPNASGQGAHYEIGGTTIRGVPTTLWVENGIATKVLKVGALERGELDMLVATQAAQTKAPATGTTIPSNKPVESAVAAGR